MSQATPLLSIVIGALNEEKRIGRTLQALHIYLSEKDMLGGTEIVIVTADATDRTHEVVKQGLAQFPLSQHLLPGKRVGKGRDISYGMLRARGKAVIFMDADMATPLYHIQELYDALQKKPEALVIGVRDIRKIHSGFRSLLSVGGNILFKLGTGLYIRDTQCGLKGMSNANAQLLFSRLQIMEWGFDMEIIAIAHSHKLPIIQIPINDWEDVDGGNLQNKRFSVALQSLKELAQVCLRNIRGEYR